MTWVSASMTAIVFPPPLFLTGLSSRSAKLGAAHG
jgi:hypothetical protein